ncbi:ArsR/SmtB family transcription factor [Streptomyces sp. NPDC091281]|uniref:ArsR/SmtB family transcription factor n=1 Tax=Streptomyces sp. NPDC091281 TaxID=3365985 RepID=UPI00382061A7
MIRIHLDEVTLSRTRMAVSPAAEVIAAVEILHRGAGRAPWPYTAWAERAATVLASVPETAPLRLYRQLYGVGHPRRTPDLFEPCVPEPAPALDAELAVLRATSAELVEHQFTRNYPEGVPDFLVPYRDDRERAFGRLADAFAAFWREAIAPYWPLMRTVLEEEILLRARSLAGDGPDAVLAGLGGPGRWEPPVLSLPKAKESRLEASGQRLLLVPLVFAQGRMGCSTDHPDLLRVTYQARGAAVLAGGAAAGPVLGDRLVALLGARRAAVLRALTLPATTSALARLLGLAPSTVSEQLTALRAAGVVHRRRAGRRVYYGLEPAGEELLGLFGAAAQGVLGDGGPPAVTGASGADGGLAAGLDRGNDEGPRES